jgi:hypothetical protein
MDEPMVSVFFNFEFTTLILLFLKIKLEEMMSSNTKGIESPKKENAPLKTINSKSKIFNKLTRACPKISIDRLIISRTTESLSLYKLQTSIQLTYFFFRNTDLI